MADAVAAPAAASPTEGAGKETQGQLNAQNAANTAGSAVSGNPMKDAAKEAMRKLKIDDQEIDEAEVIKTYKERVGHQKRANKEYQEGLALRKQSEDFISKMKDRSQVIEVLKKLGHDPRKLSEEYLLEQLNDDMMDPKDKELREYKKRVDAFEKKQADEHSKREKDENDKLKARYAKDYNEQFVKALEVEKLPETKDSVARMAFYIAQAAKINDPLTPAEAAKLVREDLFGLNKNIVNKFPVETLVEMLGEETLQKIRAHDMARLRDPNSGLKTPQEQGEVKRERQNSTHRMTPVEWRNHKMGR